MTVPTTQSAKTASDWFNRINGAMISTRTLFSNLSTKMATQNITGEEFLRSIYSPAIHLREVIKAGETAANLNSYAQDQFNNPALNYVTEINTTETALNSLITQIDTDMPKTTPGNWVNLERLDPTLATHVGDPLTADGIEQRTFTPAQTASIKTQIDAVIATIDAPL